MKYFLLIMTGLFCLNANAQLVLKEGSNTYLRGSNERLTEFARHNNFDYALIGWIQVAHNGDRGSYHAVVKQDGKWYLATFSASGIDYSLPDKMVLKVQQRPYSKREYKKLKKDMNLKAALANEQSEFDALPNVCNTVHEGNPAKAGSISDAATWGLLEVDGQRVKGLSKYAPEEYLKLCAATDKRYEILAPFTNAVRSLRTSSAN